MFKSKLFRAAALAMALSLSSAGANAAWIQITDPDISDSAINPGYGAGGPSNQNAATIGSWLQNLLNLANAPTVIAQNDSFGDSSISPISSAAQYLTLHYGNYYVGQNRYNDVTVGYSCASGCTSFSGYTTGALSNYRIYGGAAIPVPEPATLTLLGLGLAVLAMARRRRK